MRGSNTLPRIKAVNHSETVIIWMASNNPTKETRWYTGIGSFFAEIVIPSENPTGEVGGASCPAQMNGEARSVRLLNYPACSPNAYVGDVP